MKKIFLSIAILSASIFSSYAATDTNATSGERTRTECSKDSGKQKKGKHAKDGRGMRAFEGITLSDAQKSQIEALRAEQRAQKEAKRQQAMEAFNNKVKAILTPEQYAKYLDNTKEMAAHKDSKDKKKDGRHSKDGKFKKDRRDSGKNRQGNSRQG